MRLTGGTNTDLAKPILKPPQSRAFIITINSFGTELTKDDREKLYPTCGRLFPDGLKALARADDYDQVNFTPCPILLKNHNCFDLK